MRLPLLSPAAFLAVVGSVLAVAIVGVLLYLTVLSSDDDGDGGDDSVPEPTSQRSSSVYLAGLQSPVGLSLGLGGLLITSSGEEGGPGAVYLAKPERGEDAVSEEDVTRLVDFLPSEGYDGAPPFVPGAMPTRAVERGDSVLIVVSGEGPEAGSVLRAPLETGAAAEVVVGIDETLADILPDAEASSAFDVAIDAEGTAFVSDPVSGAILRVDARSEASLFASFGPILPPAGTAYPAAPAGLVLGPDGALYVALFTGPPYQPGRSRIYRLQDRNGDGDGGDPGERTIVADGLSFCVDLAFGPDGELYALEYATALESEESGASGRLWRLAEGEPHLLVDELRTPTSLVIDADGNALIAERDADEIRIVPDAAEP